MTLLLFGDQDHSLLFANVKSFSEFCCAFLFDLSFVDRDFDDCNFMVSFPSLVVGNLGMTLALFNLVCGTLVLMCPVLYLLLTVLNLVLCHADLLVAVFFDGNLCDLLMTVVMVLVAMVFLSVVLVTMMLLNVVLMTVVLVTMMLMTVVLVTMMLMTVVLVTMMLMTVVLVTMMLMTVVLVTMMLMTVVLMTVVLMTVVLVTMMLLHVNNRLLFFLVMLNPVTTLLDNPLANFDFGLFSGNSYLDDCNFSS
jgi:hypothetical protein